MMTAGSLTGISRQTFVRPVARSMRHMVCARSFLYTKSDCRSVLNSTTSYAGGQEWQGRHGPVLHRKTKAFDFEIEDDHLRSVRRYDRAPQNPSGGDCMRRASLEGLYEGAGGRPGCFAGNRDVSCYPSPGRLGELPEDRHHRDRGLPVSIGMGAPCLDREQDDVRGAARRALPARPPIFRPRQRKGDIFPPRGRGGTVRSRR